MISLADFSMEGYSQGMIMAADCGNKPVFLVPAEDTPVGVRVR